MGWSTLISQLNNSLLAKTTVYLSAFVCTHCPYPRPHRMAELTLVASYTRRQFSHTRPVIKPKSTKRNIVDLNQGVAITIEVHHTLSSLHNSKSTTGLTSLMLGAEGAHGVPWGTSPKREKTHPRHICIIMQNFTPIGATVAEISVLGQKAN